VKVTLTREYKINMGNYEHIVVGGSIEYEDNGAMKAAQIKGALDTLLAADLQVARDLTTHEDSFVLDLIPGSTTAPTAPPARTERSTLPRRRN
jgi:hypothetical protein